MANPMYQGIAQELKQFGRYGDTELVHMNPVEVAMMDRMTPGGLTTNPVTGEKEAFAFLIPMLGGMAGSALLGSTIGTTAATALGAGLGGYAATGDLEQGIFSGLMGGLGAGLGSVMGGGNFLGTEGALPTSVFTEGAAAPGAVELPGVPGMAEGVTQVPLAPPGMDSVASQNFLNEAAGMGMGAGGVTPAQAVANNTMAALSPPPSAVPAETSIFGDFTPRGQMPGSFGEFGSNFANVLTSPTGLATAGITAAAELTAPEPWDPSETGLKSNKYVPEQFPDEDRLKVNMPGSGYRPGFDPEYRYFNYARGGKVKRFAEGGLAQAATGAYLNADSPEVTKGDYKRFRRIFSDMELRESGPEGDVVSHDMSPEEINNAYVNIIKSRTKYADNPLTDEEILDLSLNRENGPTGFAQGGIAQAATGAQKEILESGGYSQTEDPVISNAKSAIMGSHPNAAAAIQAFVAKYGKDALKELRAKIIAMMAGDGGLTEGPGDGMSDDIRATIDGTEPAALSDGEFVIPADVVSGLGDGSTDAGASKLYNMIDKIRMDRTGTKNQPEPLDDTAAMPA